MELTTTSETRYSLTDLTQEQFDVIVGCLHVGECGGRERGAEPYYKNEEIHNGTTHGGALVLEQIPRDEMTAALRRLGVFGF